MRDRYNLNTMPVGTSEDMLEYGKHCTTEVIAHLHLQFDVSQRNIMHKNQLN